MREHVKALGIMLLIVTILATMSVYYLSIESRSLTQPMLATYNGIVWIVGDTVHTQNTATSQQFSSTDAGQAIQDLINSLDLDKGGHILITNGLYNFRSTVLIKGKGMQITGENTGWNYNPTMGTVLKAQAALPSLINDTGQWAFFDHLGFDGSDGLATYGLVVTGGDVHIEENAFDGLGTGILATWRNVWVENNWIEYCVQGGIEFQLGEYMWANNNMFYGNGSFDIKVNGVSQSLKGTAWINENRFYNSPLSVDLSGNLENVVASENSHYYLASEAYLVEGTVFNLQITNDILEGAGRTNNFLAVTQTGVIKHALVEGGLVHKITGPVINNLGTANVTVINMVTA